MASTSLETMETSIVSIAPGKTGCECGLSFAQATLLLLLLCSDPSPSAAGKVFLSCFCPTETLTAIPWKSTRQDLSFPQARLSTWGEWKIHWLSTWGEWHMAGKTPTAPRGCCHTGPESAASPALPPPSRTMSHVPWSCSSGRVKSRIARLYLSPLLQTYIFTWKSLHLWIITPINQYWKQWFNLRCEELSSQALKAATSYSVIAAAAMNTAKEMLQVERWNIYWKGFGTTMNGMPALQPPPKQGPVAWAVPLMVCAPHRAEVAEA